MTISSHSDFLVVREVNLQAVFGLIEASPRHPAFCPLSPGLPGRGFHPFQANFVRINRFNRSRHPVQRANMLFDYAPIVAVPFDFFVVDRSAEPL